MILAGDVGGTKVHLALYNFEGGRLRSLREQKYPAHEYASLGAVIEKFLEVDNVDPKEIAAACFGVPGPVRGGASEADEPALGSRYAGAVAAALDRAYLSDQRS